MYRIHIDTIGENYPSNVVIILNEDNLSLSLNEFLIERVKTVGDDRTFFSGDVDLSLKKSES
jgi:hypothetical protein